MNIDLNLGKRSRRKKCENIYRTLLQIATILNEFAIHTSLNRSNNYDTHKSPGPLLKFF